MTTEELIELREWRGKLKIAYECVASLDRSSKTKNIASAIRGLLHQYIETHCTFKIGDKIKLRKGGYAVHSPGTNENTVYEIIDIPISANLISDPQYKIITKPDSYIHKMNQNNFELAV